MSLPFGRCVLAIALLDFALTNFAYIFLGDWSAGDVRPFIYEPMKIAAFLYLFSIPAIWLCRSEIAVRIFIGWFMFLALTHAGVFLLIAFAKPAVG